MISTLRFVVVSTLIFCAAVFAAVKFAPVSEASAPAPEAVRVSGSQGAPLASSLTFGREPSARRSVDNPKIINIQSGRDLKTGNIGTALAAAGIDLASARPLSLASDDINNDGFPDLVAGYGTAEGGFLLVYYGDSHAFAPKTAKEIQEQIANNYPEPFASVTLVLLDHAPDLLATGDFDRDGHVDILTAATGGNSINLSSGSTDGIRPAKAIPMPGTITAMTAGLKTQPDSYGEAWVAVSGDSGAQLLDLGRNGSIFTEKPRVVTLPAAASALAIGRLDEDRSEDVAVIAGGKLYISHGDGTDQWNDGVRPDAKAGTLESVDLSFGVTAVAVNDFIWDRDERMEMAVAADDGSVSILARGELDKRPYTPDEARQRRYLAAEAHLGHAAPPELASNNKTDGWKAAESTYVNLSAPVGGKHAVLTGMLASAQNSYDLLALNSGSREIDIAYPNGELAPRSSASFSTSDEPVAVLPMRLNMHGHAGLVVLQAGKIEPTIMMFAPSATFTVTKTADTNDGACNADCSLREAIVAANAAAGADVVSVPAGIYQLTIAGDENNSASGDLDINSDITVSGAGAGNTFIQGSSSATFTGNMGDKAFGINQAGTNSTLIATISNLTVRFTRNDIAVNGAFTQTGGATDVFLTGTGGAPGPTTTFTNVTYDSNANSHSYGGAINIDSGDLAAGTNIFRGTIQMTGSTISNNKTLTTTLSDDIPSGGGINLFSDKHNVTISSSTINANQTSQRNASNGGGIHVRHSFGGVVTVNSTTNVTNNIAAAYGGGIMIASVGGQTFSMTGGSVSGNTSQGNGGSGEGGGIYNGNPVGSTSLSGITISNNVATAGTNGRGGGVEDGSNVPLSVDNCTITGNSADSGGAFATTNTGGTQTMTVTNSVITGNSASATGGAFYVVSGILNANLNYINSNTAPTGSGVAQAGGTATVQNNWWGCDGFPNAAGCQTGSGTFNADPRIDLTFTASPSQIQPGQTSTLTAAVNKNSNGTTINPTVMNGRTLNFAANNGGVAPTSASLASLTASTVYTNNGTCGLPTASATLDAGPQNVTITVVCPPTYTKAFGATNISLNSTTSLTFTVTNSNTTVALSGITFTDSFPAGLSVASPLTVTNNCGGTLQNDAGGVLAAGATGVKLISGTRAVSSNCTISVNVAGTTEGAKANTGGVISATESGNGVASNTATVNVISPPTFTKSFGAASIPVGGSTSLSFTITNTSSVFSLSGIGFTDNLPAGLVVSTPNGVSGSCGGGTITAVAGSTSISLSGATLAANTPCTFSASVTGTAEGVKNNSATLSTTQLGTGATANASISVIAAPTFSTNFTTSPIVVGQTSQLNIIINNPATNPASLTGVSFTDTLPAGITVASATTTPCGGTLTVTAPSTVALSGATIAAGGNCTLAVSTTGTAAGSFTNTINSVSSTNGGTNSTPASGSITVNKASTTTALGSGTNPSVSGQSVTFTATISVTAPGAGSPTGTVTFKDNAVNIGSCAAQTVSANVATCTITSLSVATHPITAVYNGDSNFNASPASNTVSQVVNKASTTTALVSGTNPSVFGQSVTFTATVSVTSPGSGTPTGTVSFFDNAVSIGSCSAQTVSSSQATCSISSLSVATHPITAVYNGDASFNASAASNTVSQVVNKASTSTALASGTNPSVFGQSVTFTATVSATAPGAGTPTGNVTFQDNGVNIAACAAQTVSSGTATCTVSSLSVATHPVTATYNGDGNFNSSAASNTVNQVVNKASTTTALVSGTNPSVFGQSVTFTATVSVTSPGAGTPTGNISFFDNAVSIGSCSAQTISSNVATCSISSLTAATHPITAVYNGDGNFAASAASNTVSQVVNKASTTVALVSGTNPSNAGQSVTFTATISVTAPGAGSPTGNVSFFDNAVSIGTCAAQTVASGQATCSISTLLAGTHPITAVYNGDGNFNASPSSNTVSQVVNAGDTIPPTANATFSNVLVPGGTTYTFNVTYADNVAVNVSTLDNSDIVVTGPNAFSTPATFVSVDVNTNGTPRVATYSFTPPGGTWDAADNGTYTVSVAASQVADTNGNFVGAGSLGTFYVLPLNLVVDRTDDSAAANACTAAPNDCSLRGAIAAANAATTPDTITFDPVVFATPQTITLGGTEIVIANNGGLTINGPGPDLLTVSGNGTSRIFTNSANAVTTISGMRLTGGTGTGASGTGRGGAVYNTGGQLTLNGLVITGNTSTNGAGLSNATSGAVLTIVNCWVTGNTTPGSGGGLQNFSGVTTNIIGSSFTGNVANSASTGGGAIQANGTVTITNSTIGGNSAPASSAGGIYYNGTALTITNSTIAGNTSLNNGGGIHAAAATTLAAPRNSIIAGNSGTATSVDVTGTFASNGNNIIGVVGTSGGWVGTDQQNVNPLLAPLGYYGGNGYTFALTSASPAINAGQACVTNLTCSAANPPVALTADQRGALRIGAVDVGSFELNNSANGGTYVANLPSGLQGTAYSFLLVPVNGAFSQTVTTGSLPPNILLNSGATATLAGTPSLSGDFPFSITSSGGGNSNVTDYHLVVFAPVGTLVSVSGRVTTTTGQNPGSVTLILTDSGVFKQQVVTSPLGYYQFSNVPAGTNYTISTTAKRYQFTPVTFAVPYNITNQNLSFTVSP